MTATNESGIPSGPNQVEIDPKRQNSYADFGFDPNDSVQSTTDALAPTVATSGATASNTTLVVGSGNGIIFDDTFTANCSQAYINCIVAAENAIRGDWTNSVTLNLEFDAQAEGQNGDLASNSFFVTGVSYATLKNTLTSLATQEPTNTYLQQAVSHLTSTDPSGGAGFELPFAYARMLGLTTSVGSPDDTVTLNTSYGWSYGQDVINAVEHEISEGAMGRIGGLGDDNSFWSTMDLFRYNSSGQLDDTDGRDGRTTYFSYNGGSTLSQGAGLSFNNEFNSVGAQVNSGDTADFNELDVFGVGNPGETNTLSQTDIEMMDVLGWNPAATTNPSPPSGTTSVMVLNDANGDYDIDDMGDNAVLASYSLTQISSPWQVAGLGGFDGTDTADMLMRNSSTGAFELYDVRNNNVTGTASMGQVGLGWSVAGFGDFSSSPGETDMLMRNTNTGQIELFDISNNGYKNFYGMGQVGLAWSVSGFGDFSGNPGETDMLMRNANTGAFELFDISNNQYTGFYSIGTVGLAWQVAGFGDFSGKPNESDMLMRNTTTGQFELYDISDNQMSPTPISMGQVGLGWSVVGFGDISGNPGETDMLMENSTNALELFDINNNQYTGFYALGQVPSGWSIDGIAADPPTSGAQVVAGDSAAAGGGIAPSQPSAPTNWLTEAIQSASPAPGAAGQGLGLLGTSSGFPASGITAQNLQDSSQFQGDLLTQKL